ncbi:MAG TPA: SMR family transporter [Candidatus Binatia bacterium]|jgi:quaternary ammonium compound-resistance protein SugE|nr:SMR family transporter [Candidatus Binatia bacterium]
MAWLILLVASAFEVVMAQGLKASHGFTDVRGSVIALLGAAASMYLLAVALRSLPVGTGYAVWTGLGAVGTAAFGMLVLGESRDPMRLVAIGAILAGVIGLKLVTPD